MAVTYVRNDQGEFELVGSGTATTDTTLSQMGKPADAAAVGSALSNYSKKNHTHSTATSSADGFMSSEDKNKLDNVNTFFSNPNLLINGNFRNPINQRGQTSYTGSGIYSIDRWYLVNLPTLTVQDGSIKFEQSSGATYTGRLIYKFEHALPSNYYTISMNILSCNGGASMDDFGTIPNGFIGIFTATTTSEKILTALQFYVAAGRSIEIEWIKLEQGTIATPFVPRLYGEEMILCQRYYQYFDRTPIFASSSTNVTYFMPVQFRVPMRSNPTKSLKKILNSSAEEQIDIDLIQCVSTVYNVANIQFSKTIGQYGYVTIAFDAEIY